MIPKAYDPVIIPVVIPIVVTAFAIGPAIFIAPASTMLIAAVLLGLFVLRFVL